ncbi:MAG: hypothetical protein IKW00_03535 [Clostridia bacterium]|nr:hypothetical protein [Clostridia bacterium]
MLTEGVYTRCPLNDADVLRPSAQATAADTLQLALELSKLAYTMDVAPWLDAGWQDVSFQVDDMLLTDLPTRKGCEQAAQKARNKLDKLDPISQFLGFRRQREALDTCKAVTLSHPLSDGSHAIVVSFTGTTRRLYEWLSNLRIDEKDGFHAGFLQLTRIFEENEEKILFPQIAAQFNLPRLSLGDILNDLRKGGSRYSLIVTGHSQGAALMQIYIYHLLQSGIPAGSLRGIGFASPGVAAQRDIALATDYPVLNIINADDLISRMGGRMHVGMCKVLPSSAEYRKACYGPRTEEPVVQDTLAFLHGLRHTEDAMLAAIALLETLDTLPEQSVEELLGDVLGSLIPDKIAGRLRGYARKSLHAAERRIIALCQSTAGALRTDRLYALRAALLDLYIHHGPKETLRALLHMLIQPHSLAEKNEMSAYQGIVTEYARQLISCIWLCAAEPVWDRAADKTQAPRESLRAYDRFRPLSAQRRKNQGR